MDPMFSDYDEWQEALKAEAEYKRKDDRNINIIIALSIFSSITFYILLINYFLNL